MSRADPFGARYPVERAEVRNLLDIFLEYLEKSFIYFLS
jgi:hypothetical protein